MYSIEIEKNYFCDTLHPFPSLINCDNYELFENSVAEYRASFKEYYSEEFDVTEISDDHSLRFSLDPKSLPRNYLIYQLLFSITSEIDVQAFWSYFANEKVKSLYTPKFMDLISVVYGLISFCLSKKEKDIEVLIKETEYAYVIEFKGLEVFSPKALNVFLKDKNFIKYFFHNESYTLFCPKEILDINPDTETVLSEQEEALPESLEFLQDSSLDNHSKISFSSSEHEDVLQLYDFFDYYELDEVIELINEINSMILVLLSSTFQEEEGRTLVRYIKSVARIFIASHESFALGMHIDNLAHGIEDNLALFLEQSKDMANLCGAFSHDLNTWLKKLFFEGTPSLHFLDDSIITNCQTIVSLITKDQEEVKEENLNDIFEF